MSGVGFTLNLVMGWRVVIRKKLSACAHACVLPLTPVSKPSTTSSEPLMLLSHKRLDAWPCCGQTMDSQDQVLEQMEKSVKTTKVGGWGGKPSLHRS